MKFKFIVVAAMLPLLTACGVQEPQMTPLEIQSMQTRQFDAKFDTSIIEKVKSKVIELCGKFPVYDDRIIRG